MRARATEERLAFNGKAIELGKGQSPIRIGHGQGFLSLWPDEKLSETNVIMCIIRRRTG